MPALPDAEIGEGEVWIRDGEMYIPGLPALIVATGALAIFPYDGEVWAYVPNRGKVKLEELLKPALQAVK